MVGLRKINIEKLGNVTNMLDANWQVFIGFMTFAVCGRGSVDVSITEEAVLWQCEGLYPRPI